MLKGIINSEKKTHEVGAALGVSTTGNIIHLTGISIGDSANEREGNSIFMRSISARFNTTCNSSATSSFIRMILIEDLQQVADTGPTMASVLQSDVMSSLNSTTIGRYKVLYNKLYTVNNTDKKSIVWTKYWDIKHHVRYNGSGVADIQKGGLYLLLLSSEATNTPTITYNIRLGYYDN
ncbi:TPA: hypothetical protein HFC92_005492 [Escherichia coli]|nr:hypothetical protein [Escherichia coli]